MREWQEEGELRKVSLYNLTTTSPTNPAPTDPTLVLADNPQLTLVPPEPSENLKQDKPLAIPQGIFYNCFQPGHFGRYSEQPRRFSYPQQQSQVVPEVVRNETLWMEMEFFSKTHLLYIMWKQETIGISLWRVL